MANILKKKSPYAIPIPGQRGMVVKIWTDTKEPPKKYIWNYNDTLYFWDNGSWNLLEEYLKDTNNYGIDPFVNKVKHLSLLELFEMRSDT